MRIGCRCRRLPSPPQTRPRLRALGGSTRCCRGTRTGSGRRGTRPRALAGRLAGSPGGNHVAWGVGSVDVAECRRDQVPAALADTQGVGDAEEVPGGRVKVGMRVVGPGDAVLLPAYHTAFELEHYVELGAHGEQLS